MFKKYIKQSEDYLKILSRISSKKKVQFALNSLAKYLVTSTNARYTLMKLEQRGLDKAIRDTKNFKEYLICSLYNTFWGKGLAKIVAKRLNELNYLNSISQIDNNLNYTLNEYIRYWIIRLWSIIRIMVYAFSIINLGIAILPILPTLPTLPMLSAMPMLSAIVSTGLALLDWFNLSFQVIFFSIVLIIIMMRIIKRKKDNQFHADFYAMLLFVGIYVASNIIQDVL